MPSWFWIICLFGFLLAFEKDDETRLFRREAKLKPLLGESLRLLWQSAVLISAYHWGLCGALGVREAATWLPAFLLPLAFVLGLFEKDSRAFFLTLFTVSFFAAQNDALPYPARLIYGTGLVLGLTLFEILLVAVAAKLELSRLEKPMEGLPVLFLCAAILALAFWGFQAGGGL